MGQKSRRTAPAAFWSGDRLPAIAQWRRSVYGNVSFPAYANGQSGAPMQQARAGRYFPMPLAGRVMPSSYAVTLLGLSVLLIVLWALGLRLNADADDLLKLHEVRTFLQTGNVFDRTLPGILQPEPYVTHWPWIVDLPYAAPAFLLKPIVGTEAALRIACWVVPLLLLAPALYLYGQLVTALGFASAFALPLAVIFALRGFFEFAPDRIDYHNLQILLLLASLVLLLSRHRIAALTNGSLTASALAISMEFAPFYALVMGVYAFGFIFDRPGERRAAMHFGAALVVASVVFFAVIVPPTAYGQARCDSYSMPQMAALCLAGLSFLVVPKLTACRMGWKGRAGLLFLVAAGSLVMLAFFFPSCLHGPYVGFDSYARLNFIDSIPQERSLLRRPDFVLSRDAVSMAIMFVGTLAPSMVFLLDRDRRSRAIVVIALFGLLALVLGIVQFRYLRYASVFSGLGLLFVLSPLLPRLVALPARREGPAAATFPYVLVIPGAILAAVVVAFNLMSDRVEPVPAGADLADNCDSLPAAKAYEWPAESRVLAPPVLGAALLAREPGLAVVAVGNHPARLGLERVYRFLDPQTRDARAQLDASHANLVAVCALRDGPVAGFEEQYPLASALMTGHPPPWLVECPADAASPLRVYRYGGPPGSEGGCPVPAGLVQARP